MKKIILLVVIALGINGLSYGAKMEDTTLNVSESSVTATYVHKTGDTMTGKLTGTDISVSTITAPVGTFSNIQVSTTGLYNLIISTAQWTRSADGVNIWNTNTGNVGIGTTAPLDKLQVAGGGLITSSITTSIGDSYLYISTPLYINAVSGISLVSTFEGGIMLGKKGTNWLQLNASAEATIRSRASNDATTQLNFVGQPITLQHATGNIKLQTNANGVDITGSAGFSGSIISSGSANSWFTGNVGIGTTNPGYKLEVSSSAWFGGYVSAESFIDRTPYPDTKQIAYDSINSIRIVLLKLKLLKKYLTI